MIDLASLVILERTLELASEQMPQAVQAAESLNLMQRYVELPDPESEKQLCASVAELITAARSHQQFLIAARCQAFLQQVQQRSEVA